MTREFLKGLDLEDEVIDKIMGEHGKAVTKSTEQLNAVKGQLKTAEDTLKKFEGIDPEKIKGEIETYKTNASNAKTDAEAKIAELEFSAALKDALNDTKFTSKHAKEGVMAQIKAKGLKLENGAIIGLEDTLKSIRETHADSFVVEGQKPPAMYGGTGNAPITPEGVDPFEAVLGKYNRKKE
ncbi:MAG: phage scaffolding protein [Clostridiales bacterium]|jgi:hypothetical protein|nr:phage scaffolding protein [Clostridiales bacterium]